MSKITAFPEDEQRVVLRDISWETYQCLLRDHQSHSAPRFTYDHGTLEIMSPLIRHEETNRRLDTVVEAILDAWEWDYRNLGSTTFKREDAEQGFEPDTCFYIQSVEQIGDRETLDLLAGDPPPDLVIEIDLYHSSVPKLPLFAGFGVPEVWWYAHDRLTIHVLDGEAYSESGVSRAVPGLTADELNRFLVESRTTRRPAWLRTLRQWATDHRPDAV